jgi:hypothetical protein
MPDEERWKQLWPKLHQVQRLRSRVSWVYASELPGLEAATHLQAQVARTAARLRADSERQSAEQRLREVGIRSVACTSAELTPIELSPAGQAGVLPSSVAG